MIHVKLTRPQREADYRVAEAYKALRTNIQFCGVENRVIMLTSSMPGEGKTSTSFNLAASLAEIGKKVVLIDADMRKSNLVKRYMVEIRVKGLSQLLSGQNTIEEVLCETSIPNLHMIFAGAVPPNPAELLNGAIFEKLVGAMKKMYDYVIIDTPPLGSVADAAVVSRNCDGMVFVCAAGEVKRKFVQDIVRQATGTGCKLLGVVLTKAENGGKGYYNKYYGKYYGKYGEE